ncbi:MAG TPA: LamG-like jellyroll fold domain-containing protein [Armatimonadota bacterium]|nr:LamG-like jellyroll fold domain-containing protein [Armatimonadota bacterium]
MRRVIFACGLLAIIPCHARAQDAPRLREPWEAEYAGDDATGAHVVALWQFGVGAEGDDASGNGHAATLTGAALSENGRFGGGLESFRGWPDIDEKYAAVVPANPALTPTGAFTIEMHIQPRDDLDGYPESFLIDNRYIDDTGYQLILSAADTQGLRRLRAGLGFGDETVWFSSRAQVFEAARWYHVAMVYDGAGGLDLYIDGLPAGGGMAAGRTSVAPGTRALSIGDRVGSYYHGFPGVIDQVRIANLAVEFGRAGARLATARKAYLRMEQAPPLRVEVTNLDRAPMAGAKMTVSVAGIGAQEFPVPNVEPRATHVVEYLLDTSLRPAEYELRVALEIPGDPPVVSERSVPVYIAARPNPERMPVLMWGVGWTAITDELDRLKRIGFTHALGLGADFGTIWDAGAPTAANQPDHIADRHADLDAALVAGIRTCASLSPGRWLRENEDYRRVGRDGEHYAKHDICGLFPEAKEFCYNVGASVAQTYGDFPALDSAMIHTEVRGEANPCFHEHDLAAYREATGLEIPDEVQSKNGVDHARIDGFPADRVIADDDPIYRYLQWYWKHGDGWNALNTALHDGLKSTGRDDLWTFHDPAVRVAKVYGTGGGVDYVSQWTYSYPDPLRIGTVTDELAAMARGAGDAQDLMKMTQIIWYRSQTAPMSEESQDEVAAQTVWEDTDPDAAFVTISPMQLREAFWTKIARPIKGIMYHGWQSLVPTDSTSAYRYTHPQTQHELTRLVREVVQPLGPTLRQVPDVQADVAVLQSFASEMFARRGTYGWGHTWIGDMYLVCQWARLQTEIVFDETVMDRGLDDFKVLVMPDCDVLTAGVVERVKAFQDRGGIIVGDERLCPAITPDIILIAYERTRQADDDKAALQALAAKLREELSGHYTRYADSTNADVVPRYRRFSDTDYVFLINDHREFGDYVGHHGLVMEQGLPSDATETVARGAGVVYDLVAGRQVAATVQDGKLSIDVHVEPGGGQLLMVTPDAIAAVSVDAPDSAARGDALSADLTVADVAGDPIDAVVPVHVQILDPDGIPAETSGHYATIGGRLQVVYDVAPNDRPGLWEIRVEELASGTIGRKYVRVN